MSSVLNRCVSHSSAGWLGRLTLAGLLAAGIVLYFGKGVSAFASRLDAPTKKSAKTADQTAKPKPPANQKGRAVVASGNDVTPVPTQGKVWAVVVAVNTYQDTKHIGSLRFCVSDAELFAQTVVGDPARLLMLSTATAEPDRQPTRENILKAIREIGAKTAPEDQFWFFFAGHGLSQGGISYLIPADALIPELKTCLSESELLNALKSCKARTRALALDACRNEWSRGGTNEKPFRILIQDNNGNTVTRNFVFTACRVGQFASEFPDIEHGVFTYTFVNGLAGKAAEEGKETINLAQLKAYVEKEMAARAPQQNPEFLPEANANITIAARNPAALAQLAKIQPVKPAENRKPLGPFVVIVPEGLKASDNINPILAELRQACISAGCVVYNDEIAREFLALRNDPAQLKQRFISPLVLKVNYHREDTSTPQGNVENIAVDVSIVVTLEDAERQLKFTFSSDGKGAGGTARAARDRAHAEVKAKIQAARKLDGDLQPLTLTGRIKKMLTP